MADTKKKNVKELSYAELVAERDELKEIHGLKISDGNWSC